MTRLNYVILNDVTKNCGRLAELKAQFKGNIPDNEIKKLLTDVEYFAVDGAGSATDLRLLNSAVQINLIAEKNIIDADNSLFYTLCYKYSTIIINDFKMLIEHMI